MESLLDSSYSTSNQDYVDSDSQEEDDAEDEIHNDDGNSRINSNKKIKTESDLIDMEDMGKLAPQIKAARKSKDVQNISYNSDDIKGRLKLKTK